MGGRALRRACNNTESEGTRASGPGGRRVTVGGLPRHCFARHLLLDELGICPALSQEVVVGALLDGPAVLDDDDAVGVFNGGEPEGTKERKPCLMNSNPNHCECVYI